MPNTIDTYSRHAHYLEQYFNGQANKIDPFLRRVAKKLRLELTKTQTVTSKKRTDALLNFTEDLLNSELKQFTEDLSGQIELFAVSEAAFAVETVAAVKGFEMVIPAPNQLYTAVNARPFNNRLLKNYLSEFSATQARAVREAVSLGFYEGQTTQQIVQGIIGTKSQSYKNGTLNVTRTSANTMVRTALSHTAATAKSKTFTDNSDIIPYYEWVATLDGRTSPLCRARDGQAYKVGKGPLPPAHYNCRSTTSPLFADEVNPKTLKKLDTGGRRASVNGQVNADLNYNDWLANQSKSFQVDVLGKTKADLFRKGELTMDKFVNNKGQELTLDQLKDKYPTAWAKI